MDKLKTIYASAVAAMISITTSVAVTIGTDLSKPFKKWLEGFTGHHWLTKSWLSIIVFVAAFLVVRTVSKEPSETSTGRAVSVLVWLAIFASFILLGFYIFEYATK